MRCVSLSNAATSSGVKLKSQRYLAGFDRIGLWCGSISSSAELGVAVGVLAVVTKESL